MNEPRLDIIDLVDMEMNTDMEVLSLITKAREFLMSVHASLKEPYDEGNHVIVGERLTLLANVLPSATMAKAISIKAFHKKKLEVMVGYLNDPEKKKLGTQMIKDIARDHCYSELALMTLADETHDDIKEQIGSLRSILAIHRAEIEARIGGNQT